MRAATKVSHSKCAFMDAVPAIKQPQHSLTSQRPKTLKSWDEECMNLAVEAMKENICTICEVAVIYKVPK